MPDAVTAPAAPPVATEETPATGTVPSADQGSWSAAAQPSSSSAAAPPVATEETPATGMVPSQPAPPVVLKPNKPSGLAGIVDGMLNVMTGKTKPETATGSDGQTYVKQTSLTHGEQWLRVADAALHGAGAGMQAGRGRNGGAALAAGIGAGDKVVQGRQQQQQNAQAQAGAQNAAARQAKLDQYNFVKLQQENAARAFDMQHAGVKATQDDIEFAQKQDAYYKDQGYADMGVATDPAHLADTQKDNPNFWKDVHDGKIIQNKEYDDNGNVVGVHLWHTAGTDLSQLAPKGAALVTWQPPVNPNDPNDKGKFVSTPTSGDYTNGQIQTYKAKAEADRDAFQLKQQAAAKAAADLAHTKAETGVENANASKAPSEIRKNDAEANNSNAEADKNRATADKLKTGEVNEDGTPNPKFEELAQSLYDGDLLPKDLKREAKGSQLDPNAIEARAIEIGKANGKKWSSTIIEQEQKFAENTKTQAALDGIKRVIGSPNNPNGYMQQMLDMAQKADLGTHGAFNSASLAIRRWRGDTDAKNFNTAVSETRRSIAGLIGNPLLGGSDSDKKLQQADDMLGQSPTLENLQGAADLLTSALKTSHNSMVSNNRFLSKRYGTYDTGTPDAAPAAAAPAAARPAAPAAGGSLVGAIQPGEHVTSGPAGQIVWRGGKWVNPQTGQAVQ